MLTKKFRFISLCLLMVMVVSSASAAPMTSSNTLPQAATTGAYTAAEVVPGYSPLTGEPFDGPYRPVVVQISNSKEARPHMNMSEADIVYEAVYWGPAHTRYTAIYNDNHPSVVASVRSARVYHSSIRQEWDTLFVFWGGQDASGTSIYEFFKVNNVDSKFLNDGTKNGKGLFRIEGRVNPHNAAANLEEIVNNYWPTGDDGNPYEPKMHAYSFSSTPTYGADSAMEIYIPYDEAEYFPSYRYNASDRVYERFYNGEEQYDGASNKRLVASNVIVQFAELSFFQNSRSRPQIKLVGSGVIDAFIDGRHVRGTWERQSENDRTVFLDMNGNPLTLLPGKTFIQIFPANMAFSYVRDDGTEMTMEFGTEVMPPMYDTNETDEGIDAELQ